MNRRKLGIGILLIIIGTLWGLERLAVLPEINFLFFLAAGFFLVYVLSHRKIGFLIPGCILLSIGIYAALDEAYPNLSGGLFMILLGMAFFEIFIIHHFHNERTALRKKHWPLYPGTILILLGAAIMFFEEELMNISLENMHFILPSLLILIGLLIVVKNLWKPSLH